MEPKKPGKPRNISILIGDKQREITLYDAQSMERQRALLRQHHRSLKKQVHQSAYGFVEGRSPWTAAQEILKRQAGYRHAIVCDIKSFFPSINRKRLSIKLRKTVSGAAVDEMMRIVSGATAGIAQGSALSPMLSNCYLFEMDQRMASLTDTFYIRYADDILLLTQTPQRAMKLLEECLAAEMLTLNADKLKSGQTQQGFSFLGFDFTPRKLFIAHEKQLEMNARMRAADLDSRRAIFQGYQAHFRHTNYLRPHMDTLRWILQYAPLTQQGS